jgi:hypothetical protein
MPLNAEESTFIRRLWKLSSEHSGDVELQSLQNRLRMPEQSFQATIGSLAEKMILNVRENRSANIVSLTPLGMAILRKLLDRDLEGLISQNHP